MSAIDGLPYWGGALAAIGVARLRAPDRAAELLAETVPSKSTQLALGKKVVINLTAPY